MPQPVPWGRQSWERKRLNPCDIVVVFNVYVFLRQRERDRMRVGEGQREGDPGSEAGSRLRAVSTDSDAGLAPTNREIMT